MHLPQSIIHLKKTKVKKIAHNILRKNFVEFYFAHKHKIKKVAIGGIMGLIENVKNNFSSDELSFYAGFRLVMIGANALFIEGVKGLIYYTETEIAFALKKGKVIVKGKGLYVKKYCEGDAVVCGEICAILKS